MNINTIGEVIKLLQAPWDSDNEASFDRTARLVFAHQYERNPIYRRICEASKLVDPSAWFEIPLLSAEMFKLQNILCSPHTPQSCKAHFQSSGTTTRRSVHHFSAEQLNLYELSLWQSFSRAFSVNAGDIVNLLFLSENPLDKPTSSLIHMFGCIASRVKPNICTYLMSDGKLNTELAKETLAKVKGEAAPTIVAGTAFAFVQLIDAGIEACELPANSGVMITGGFKGRSRQVEQGWLHSQIAIQLGLEPHNIITQYGMSELCTQFYSQCRLKREVSEALLMPPWCKVRILNPMQMNEDQLYGEPGLIAVYDLANIHSCAFLLTGDVGVALKPGIFRLLGRASTGNLKGCSLNYELRKRLN